MFSESDKLQAKLYAQAQIDLDHLADDARKNGYAHGDIQFYSRMFKRKLFTHYYSRVKQLALLFFIFHSERKIL